MTRAQIAVERAKRQVRLARAAGELPRVRELIAFLDRNWRNKRTALRFYSELERTKP